MKKEFAIFTVVKNEEVFLPIWLSYYTRFNADIFVLNHESNDGSIEKALEDYGDSITVVNIFNPLAFDHRWITDTVQHFQKKLLEEYRVVLFTEIDEIVWNKFGLDSYADEFNKPAVKCNGFDLIHMPEEDNLDLSLPILDQRNFWFYSPVFQCKPLMTTEPMEWCYGYHGAKGITKQDNELYLIHLNRMDFNLSYERNLSRQKMKFHEGDKKAGFGFQKSLTGEAFKDWFYNFRNDQPIVKIPDYIKKANIV